MKKHIFQYTSTVLLALLLFASIKSVAQITAADFVLEVDLSSTAGVAAGSFMFRTTGATAINVYDPSNLVTPLLTIAAPGADQLVTYSGTPSTVYIAYSGTITDIVPPINNVAEKITNIIQWGTTNLTRLSFRSATNLVDIAAGAGLPNFDIGANLFFGFGGCVLFEDTNKNLENWNTTNVTNMASMFHTAAKFNTNLNNWDVSNVTTFNSLFESVSVSIFNNGAVIGATNTLTWDLSSAINIADMFYRAISFNADISEWILNTNPAVNINASRMFYDARVFNQDISKWNVSRVSSMRQLFDRAAVFNNGTNNKTTNGIGGWDVSNITGNGYEYMFRSAAKFDRYIGDWTLGSGATSLQSMFSNAFVFDKDLSKWNVSNITNMRYMFYDAEAFTNDANTNVNPGTSLLGLNGWDVNKVINFDNMFSRAENFNVNISDWQINTTLGAAINMSSMFSDATVFDQDLSKWNVSEVTLMPSMFKGADAFKNGANILSNVGTGRTGLNGWDVGKVTNFSSTFYFTINTNHVFNVDIKDWDMASVTTTYRMFRGQRIFNQDLSNWDVSNVVNFTEMFLHNYVFTNGSNNYMGKSINDWDVSSSTNFSSMFYQALLFNRNIGDWEINYTTLPTAVNVSMFRMFLGADAFNQDISKWNVSRVNNMEQMFSGTDIFNNGDNTNINSGTGRTGINGWDVSNVSNYRYMFNGAKAFNRDIDNWNTTIATNMERMFNGAIAFNQNLASWEVPNVSNFSLFLSNSGLSTNTYDQFLMAWADKDLIDNQTIGLTSLKYCTGLAARDRLISEQGITFSGDSRECSPGSYAINTIFWQNAGAISGIANGNPITEWVDLSAAENDFTATNANLNTVDAINFNPVLDFNGTSTVLSLNPFPVLGSFDDIKTTTFFVLYKEAIRENNRAFLSFNSAGSNDYYTHYSPDATNNLRFSGVESAITTVSPTTDPLDPSYIDVSVLSPDNFNFSRVVPHTLGNASLAQFIKIQGGRGTSYTGRIYEDGQLLGASETNTNNDDGSYNRTTDIFLGSLDGTSEFFSGKIAEVIGIQSNLTTNERNAVNTYFALKYSVQMDIDYLAANQSTVIWDYNEVNATYNTNVFGIGRDDAGAFNQKVSSGRQTDAILTIANENDFTSLNNVLTRSDFGTDESYVVIGHNGESTPEWSDSGAPNNFQLLNRVWKTQVTGTADVTFTQFNVDNAVFDLPVGPIVDEYYIVVDTDNDGDFSNESPQLLSNGSSGSLWSAAVSLANGNLFTLATPLIITPGGVAATMWLKANKGVLDATGSEIIIDDTNITTWKDLRSDNDATLHEGIIKYRNSVDKRFNFNPVLQFEKANGNDILKGVRTPLNSLDKTFSVYYVLKGDMSGPGREIFSFGNADAPSGFVLQSSLDDTAQFAWALPGSAIIPLHKQIGIISAVAKNDITNFPSLSGDGVLHPYLNGGLITAQKKQFPTNEPTFSGEYYIGGSITGTPEKTPNYLDFAEIIIYESDNSLLEHNKVESYLALKYGITLDQTTAQNYTASNGITEMWDATTATTAYNNDIFGIGKDELSGLSQKVSNSVSNDGIVIVSLNENLAVPNNDITRTESQEDYNFLTVANNGGALDWSTLGRVFSCICNNTDGLGRIWEVTETITGTTADTDNDVYIGIPKAKLGRNSLPAVGSDPLVNLEIINTSANLYLLVDRSNGTDFTNNTFEFFEMVLDADNIYKTNQKVDLNDNDRFTFALIKNTSRLRHGKNTFFDREIKPYLIGN